MIAEVEVKFSKVKLPLRKLAYVRHVGPYKGDSELFERLFNQVSRWINSKGLMRPNSEAITVYHDDPALTPESEERISVGFTVPLDTQPDGEIQVMELPQVEYAVGSFEILPEEYPDAWNKIFDFMRENNLKFTHPMYESCKNDPRAHPEGKHIIDICVALQ